jgi:hypothetical protein
MVSVRIYWLCRLFDDVPATSARFPASNIEIEATHPMSTAALVRER